ncbi:hypothetical protein CesoFtcFv8_010021 [Champsocephalus esox]|uniref:Uncharacterized protein n=2 Tax=Champsocephalus TaxID=52236 RepID=A0AAN8DME7_CHAGU|nr:hypothetical protein CesoFtcFv8_010021 [Champsocephalus esox]KAK5924932.1 hypothetical protein CgunFtcFv8_017503 [Champsocephalus gunnari]
MHGSGPDGTGDQVAVDHWNASGEDVGSWSQLGCPASAGLPRLSGSGKPPMAHIGDSCCQTSGHCSPNRSSLLCVGGWQNVKSAAIDRLGFD